MRVGVINNTAIGGHPGTQAVMQTLDRELRSKGLTPVYFWPTGVDWRPHVELLRSHEIDCIVVNGEGSIHDSKDRERSRYLCEIATFSQEILRVPAFLLNSTVYNLRQEELEHLRNFDGIYVRETQSKLYLQENGIRSTLVPDLSFFDASLPKRGKNAGQSIFVSDSIVRDISRRLEVFARSKGFNFMKMKPRKGFFALSRISKPFSKIKNLLARPRAPSLFDIATKQILTHPYFATFLDGLDQSKAVVTGRLHTVTLSLALRKPFVAIESNTPKITSVALDALRSSSRVFQATPDGVSKALASLPTDFSAHELASLDDYLKTGEVAKQQMFSEIAELVAARRGQRVVD